MNWLFDNPLANMRGPEFLILYAVAIAAAFFVAWLIKKKLDWTAKMPLPKIPAHPDPYEIAYLRGGENELLRSLIFSLGQKGFLQIFTHLKKTYIGQVTNQPNWQKLLPIERSVLAWFQETRETRLVFRDRELVNLVAPFTDKYRQNLENQFLLNPAEINRKKRFYGMLILGVLILLGGYKLTAATFHNRSNVGFLILMMIVSTIYILWMTRPKRLSVVGEHYLISIKGAFLNIKDQIRSVGKNTTAESLTFGGIDPFLLSVGVFGVGALSGTMYHEYKQAFSRAGSSENGNFGYSLAGCGSDGSGDSGGSSCGGSSCGGGGWGGCGGGS